MKNTALYWFPRILGVLYILFLSLFALDAFYGNNSLGYELLAFLEHMIPPFLLIILLVIAWRRPLMGGILFLLAGIVFTIGYATFQVASAFFCISCPLFIIGISFLIEYAIHSRPNG